MRLKSIGANAEFVRQFPASAKIVRIAIPNSRRESGLIINHTNTDCWFEFGAYPHNLLGNIYLSTLLLKGGNMDIPANYTGAIWAKWKNPAATGYLNVHHYYYQY